MAVRRAHEREHHRAFCTHTPIAVTVRRPGSRGCGHAAGDRRLHCIADRYPCRNRPSPRGDVHSAQIRPW